MADTNLERTTGNFASVTTVAAFECLSKDVERQTCIGNARRTRIKRRNFRQIIPRRNYFVFSPKL